MKRIKFLTISMLVTTMLFSYENEVSGCMNINKRTKNCEEELCPIGGKGCETQKEAQQTSPTKAPCNAMPKDDFRIQIGGNYTYAWITPSGGLTVQGSLGGADAIFEYRPLNSVYAGISFAYHQGTPTNEGLDRSLMDFDSQERIGYTAGFTMCGNARLALFTGFGGRYMHENVTAGTASVKFNYVQFYVPVGFLFEHRAASCFSWGINAQWKPQIFPTVNIVPMDGARWILTKKLNNFLVDVPLSFFATDHLSIVVDPFYELWHDGQSTAATITGLLLGLPGNKYTFAGVNVNIAWSF
jgi:hypothetical protein